MVGRLVHRPLGVAELGVFYPGVSPAIDIRLSLGLVVDLVEGHPVFDLVLVPLHDGDGVADKEVNAPAVEPASVVLGKVVGHFKVAQGDNRLNAVLEQGVKEVVIEFQSRLVGLVSLPLGKIRLQEMEVRKHLKPISAKSLMSSL